MSTSPTTLIPLGAAEGANGVRAEPRVLDYVLYDGAGVSLEADDEPKFQPFLHKCSPEHVLDWDFPDDGASQYDTKLRHQHFQGGAQQQQQAKL